jgi:hypothetical protein
MKSMQVLYLNGLNLDEAEALDPRVCNDLFDIREIAQLQFPDC